MLPLMLYTDIQHAATSYGIEIQGDITEYDDDHWEFNGINYAHAESTPRLFRADRESSGNYLIRRIRKRSSD